MLVALLYATIIFVPLAATVVVASVTKTIALPIWVTALAKTHLLLRCEICVFGIQTLADFAELSLILFARVAATITFVPSTPTIVIVVVVVVIIVIILVGLVVAESAQRRRSLQDAGDEGGSG